MQRKSLVLDTAYAATPWFRRGRTNEYSTNLQKYVVVQVPAKGPVTVRDEQGHLSAMDVQNIVVDWATYQANMAQSEAMAIKQKNDNDARRAKMDLQIAMIERRMAAAGLTPKKHDHASYFRHVDGRTQEQKPEAWWDDNRGGWDMETLWVPVYVDRDEVFRKGRVEVDLDTLVALTTLAP